MNILNFKEFKYHRIYEGTSSDSITVSLLQELDKNVKFWFVEGSFSKECELIETKINRRDPLEKSLEFRFRSVDDKGETIYSYTIFVTLNISEIDKIIKGETETTQKQPTTQPSPTVQAHEEKKNKYDEADVVLVIRKYGPEFEEIRTYDSSEEEKSINLGYITEDYISNKINEMDETVKKDEEGKDMSDIMSDDSRDYDDNIW